MSMYVIQRYYWAKFIFSFFFLIRLYDYNHVQFMRQCSTLIIALFVVNWHLSIFAFYSVLREVLVHFLSTGMSIDFCKYRKPFRALTGETMKGRARETHLGNQLCLFRVSKKKRSVSEIPIRTSSDVNLTELAMLS